MAAPAGNPTVEQVLALHAEFDPSEGHKADVVQVTLEMPATGERYIPSSSSRPATATSRCTGCRSARPSPCRSRTAARSTRASSPELPGASVRAVTDRAVAKYRGVRVNAGDGQHPGDDRRDDAEVLARCPTERVAGAAPWPGARRCTHFHQPAGRPRRPAPARTPPAPTRRTRRRSRRQRRAPGRRRVRRPAWRTTVRKRRRAAHVDCRALPGRFRPVLPRSYPWVYAPAAERSASARSVRSHGRSTSVRPKWP
jgi:hypothetical protein